MSSRSLFFLSLLLAAGIAWLNPVTTASASSKGSETKGLYYFSQTCKTCHSNLLTSGAHAAHIGNLVTAGTVTFYNYTGNRSSGTAYRFGCTTCHPAD